MAEQHHHPKHSETSVLSGPVRIGERRRLFWVLLLTGATMIAEFVGAFLTRSLALLGDALHMLTHFGSVGLSLLAVVIAMRPAPPDKTYRYWRAEVIASLVNGLALLPIAGYVLYEAYLRWRHPIEIEVVPMLAIGAVGLVVNLACAAMLHRHSEHDLNIRGAFVHMVADTASSVGVIVAGVLVWRLGWKWSDPLIAALISVLIVAWSLGLIRDAIRILLESVPEHVDLEQIRARMRAEEGVAEVHDLHIWTITSRMHALTAHVRLIDDVPVSRTEELAHRLQKVLDREYDIQHATLQFETNHDESRCG
ncbi:MAG: cation transporter [Planctomycetes bacterium]|nr:cation transporter [Planctomycetota bacterium]